ncbi:DUF4097 family beta strand repeat-containing protein [Salinisphaera sp. SPP-AMP-43]|uniref:DUF4097 family beta strand repeat-containing protein n=1 Tax=Salinisphaera sp. SPP-AMP-43 TaxID=3121288 RepID=UPI003C6DD5A5
MRARNLAVAFVVGGMVWIGGASGAWADTQTSRRIERAIPLETGQTLRVDNLLGQVQVRPADGHPGVTAIVHASADQSTQAEQLADSVRLALTGSSSQPHLAVVYPLSQYRVYRYTGPMNDSTHDEHGSLVNGVATFLKVFWGGGNTHIRYDGQPVDIVTGDSHKGVSLAVNLVIRLPENAVLDLDNQVGLVSVEDVVGDTRVAVERGSIATVRTRGPLRATTGSGVITIADQQGDTVLKSGSGSIRVRNLVGSIRTRQGSGDFTGRQLQGALHGRAGSGDFELQDVQGTLDIRTGSGDITGRELHQIGSLRLTSGSGDTTLSGDLSEVQTLSVKSGSGDIELATSRAPSMHVTAKTSSGDIDANWPGDRNRQSHRGYFSAVYGSGSHAGDIATGSGDIALTIH